MSDSSQEAQWMVSALLRDMPPTAQTDEEETTSAQGWRMEPGLSLATKVQKNWPERKVGAWVVYDAFQGVGQLGRFALSDRDHAAALRLIAPHSLWNAALGIIGEDEWEKGGPYTTGQTWLHAPTAPEPAGSALQGEVQYVEFSDAVLGLHEGFIDYAALQETLDDLDELSKAAEEEDVPEPDAEAVANARSILPKLYAILPVRYHVSPTERRGVAISAPMRRGGAVAVECAPDDTVYCFVAIDGNSRRAKFYQMDGLPDEFIEKALRDLAAS